MHNGLDFAAPHGTPIYASADGVVIFAGRQSAYGRLIKIKHDFGYETRYAHLSKIRVKMAKGSRAARGLVIWEILDAQQEPIYTMRSAQTEKLLTR